MKEYLKEHLRRKLFENILNERALYQQGQEGSPPGSGGLAPPIEIAPEDLDAPEWIEPGFSPIPSYNPFSPQYYNQPLQQILQWYYQNDSDTLPRVIDNIKKGLPWWHGISPNAWPPRR
jgi:hypothetical protein